MLNFTEHSTPRIAHVIYNNSVQHFISPGASMAVVLSAVCINYTSRMILRLLMSRHRDFLRYQRETSCTSIAIPVASVHCR